MTDGGKELLMPGLPHPPLKSQFKTTHLIFPPFVFKDTVLLTLPSSKQIQGGTILVEWRAECKLEMGLCTVLEVNDK